MITALAGPPLWFNAVVTVSPAQLPDDLGAMRALLLAERARHAEELAAREAALARKDGDIEKLRLIIKALQRHQFGRRSEAIDPGQLALALEEVEQTIAAAEAEQEKAERTAAAPRTGTRRVNRGALPAHLPRVELLVDVADKTCPCCSGALHVIGEDRAERLDIIPAQLRVLVIRRPKYACRRCAEGVMQAPAPARLVESGIPTEALVAQVVVAKYADHLPLYRQAQIYARQGLALDRSTLADWVGRAARELKPLHLRLIEQLNASAKLFADETTAPVLDPGRGRTKTGQLWAYARDDRPWGGADPPAVVYRYAPDRKAERPAAHLAGFAGVLQVDGYAGYRALADRGQVQLAFCWSHVRRRFYEMVAAGHAPVAAEALARINALYEIEREMRGAAAAARREARQARAKPILDALKPWLEAQLAAASKKSTLAEAIRYALSRWGGLTRLLEDGRIEIDSNTVERAIRPIALNRKNALFAGSDGGGEHWGIIASLIETCKLRSAGLSRRCSLPPRRRPPDEPHRRPAPLGIRPSRGRCRGLRTALTQQRARGNRCQVSLIGNWIRDDTHLQRHVGAAIAYNEWWYYQATSDAEAGLELRRGALRFHPALPDELKALSFQIRYRRHSLSVDMTRTTFTIASDPSGA